MNYNVVNTLYNPDDKLGVALLGASAWNDLKRKVVNITNLNSRAARAAKAEAAARAKAASQAAAAAARAKAASQAAAAAAAKEKAKQAIIAATRTSPIAAQLMGFNDAAGVEMLGASTWGKIKDSVTSATHTALNVGKQIPITSGLVDTLRDVGSYFKWGSKASSETDSAIDAAAKAIKANKIKTALILGGVGVGAAFMIYYLGKKK